MSEEVDSIRIPTPLTGPLERLREETAAVLKDGFAQGVMNLSEYEERIALATRAATAEELSVLTRDVTTALVPAEASPVSAPAVVQAQAPITAVFGSVEQEGAWRIQPEVETRAVFGEVSLDLAQVEWVDKQARIHCTAAFGSIVIAVPEDVHVDCLGIGVFGSFINRTSSRQGSPTHRLVVSGKALFGSVEIVDSK